MSVLPFHPVVQFPSTPIVYDFTHGEDPRFRDGAYGLGRYDEKRPGLYKTEIFANVRYIHMGVDLFGPVGTAVHAPDHGILLMAHYNSAAGDYGNTLVTEQILNGEKIYLLFGHLSAASIKNKIAGSKIKRGEVIGWFGDRAENGGWAPHLHFQLSKERPVVCDMPGVVSDEQYSDAMKLYPDPRVILGPIY